METFTEGDGLTSTVIFEVLGAKWSFKIIAILAEGPLHFNAIKRQLDIPGSTLSVRLGTLENQAIVSRSVEETSPPTVEYALTPKGDEIAIIIERLAEIDRK